MPRIIVRKVVRTFPKHLHYEPEVSYRILEMRTAGQELLLYASAGLEAFDYMVKHLTRITTELNTLDVVFDGLTPAETEAIMPRPVRGTIWERADFSQIAARIAEERHSIGREMSRAKRRREIFRAYLRENTGELN